MQKNKKRLDDEFYMRRCLQLASLAAGNVAPNPMVGAVLVNQDRIIGEGYHEEYGKAHAEVNCVNSVSDGDRHLIQESTMYVSLEPCSHYGKTPPCADLIVKEKIGKVKIGCIDINQQVHGQGVKRLRDAGIDVETGICEKECINLNKRFFIYHSKRRPYIILKWAQSQNGIIGRHGERIKISNDYTNQLVHKWRSEEQGILIGSLTAREDDPLLTNRYGSGRNPVRIILAGDHIPENLKMYQAYGKTMVFNTVLQKDDDKTEYFKIPVDGYLDKALDILHKSGIQSVLVEGGAVTHQKFFDKDLWDECRIITNTGMIMADGIPAAKFEGVDISHKEMIMDDLIQVIYNPGNQFAGRFIG